MTAGISLNPGKPALIERRYSKTELSIQRFRNILSKEGNTLFRCVLHSTMNKLEISHVTKRYWTGRDAREVHALSDVSLSVADAESWQIVGRAVAGKRRCSTSWLVAAV